MKRREFVALVGGVVAWPFVAARAQQPAKVPTIGFLGSATSTAWSRWTSAFVRRLAELGWVEGRSIAIVYRWGEGREDRQREIVTEMVKLNVDVIVSGGATLLVAKRLTTQIPIVFALAADPVGLGLVASLGRPGGNITGLSVQATDIAGKRLELLREVVPTLDRLAIMLNVGYPSALRERDEVQVAARKIGVEIDTLELRRAEDIKSAFAALRGRAEALRAAALYVPADPLVNSNRSRINGLALDARLPTMFGFQEYVVAGGLMSYGPSIPDLFRRAAHYVDKILKGAKPGDIPVEQPTTFELVINLNTAKALGLTVPPALLARADEVIE